MTDALAVSPQYPSHFQTTAMNDIAATVAPVATDAPDKEAARGLEFHNDK